MSDICPYMDMLMDMLMMSDICHADDVRHMPIYGHADVRHMPIYGHADVPTYPYRPAWSVLCLVGALAQGYSNS